MKLPTGYVIEKVLSAQGIAKYFHAVKLNRKRIGIYPTRYLAETAVNQHYRMSQ